MIFLFLLPGYLLINIYVGYRLLRWLGSVSPVLKKPGFVVPVSLCFALLVYSPLLALILPKSAVAILIRRLSAYWMGIILYSLLAIITAEALRFIAMRTRLKSSRIFTRAGAITAGLGVIAATALCCVIGSVHARDIKLTKYEVTVDKQVEGTDEFKIVLIADTHMGYAIGRDLSNAERFRRRGVVYMTLCHNGDNDICDSAVRTNNEHGGLSDFGREVVREMNRVGMMVDLSHASRQSFYDALETSATPIVCSHASCRALCDHPRNLDDEQMKALARRGGVMQVTLYPGFLRKDGEATILDAMTHLDHAIELMGIDHVGLGTDFDGDGGVPGLASASELINFTRQLLRRKYSLDDIRLIWGGNFLRLMEQVQGSAETKV